MYVNVSRLNETFLLSVDDCHFFLLRELCYQPLCPCFVLSDMCPFSVLLAMVPVFCVISHRVRVRVRVPCFCHRIRIRVFCFSHRVCRGFVSTIVSVSVFCVISHLARVRILCSVFQPSCPCPCSVLPDIVSQTVSTSLSSLNLQSPTFRLSFETCQMQKQKSFACY